MLTAVLRENERQSRPVGCTRRGTRSKTGLEAFKGLCTVGCLCTGMQGTKLAMLVLCCLCLSRRR